MCSSKAPPFWYIFILEDFKINALLMIMMYVKLKQKNALKQIWFFKTKAIIMFEINFSERDFRLAHY